MATAKGQLKNVFGDVKIEEIGKFLDKVGELDDFLYDVREYLTQADRRRWLTGRLFNKKRPPVPDKPEPIPTLAKETIILPHGMGR